MPDGDEGLGPMLAGPIVEADHENGQTLARITRLTPPGNVLCFAPRGSDRLGAILLPNLLNVKGPIVVVDYGGELFRATEQARQRMGQRVVRIDPLGIAGERTGDLNALDLYDLPGADREADGFVIAELFAQRDTLSDSNEVVAFSLVHGVAGYCACVPDRREVRKLVDVFYSDDVVYSLAVVLDTIGKKIPKSSYKFISAFLQMKDETRSKILATVQRWCEPFQRLGTEVLASPGTNTLALSRITDEPQSTVYLVLPIGRLPTHYFLLRIWLTILIHAYDRTTSHTSPPLFIIDRCAALGQVALLDRFLTQEAREELQLLTIWNGPAELRATYPGKWEMIAGAAEALQLLGNHDAPATREVAALMGLDPQVAFPVPVNHQLLRLETTRRYINLQPEVTPTEVV